MKKWWKSKVVWFNLIVALLLLAEANITKLQGLLPDDKYQLAAFALPIINLFMRFLSTQGLCTKLPGQNDEVAK